MTKKEALEFIQGSQAQGFRYGDLSYITEREDAIQDIENMDEDSWNDGDIMEAEDYPF